MQQRWTWAPDEIDAEGPLRADQLALDLPPQPAPEPASLALVALSMAAMLCARRRAPGGTTAGSAAHRG